MTTACILTTFDFQPLAGRQITARFDGGTITSGAGGLLLREVEARGGIIASFAECFEDFRDPDLIDFSVLELLKQRMFALCLGYKDLNDHEQLRADPLLAVWVGRNDPTGQDRLDRRDRGKPLAGKSTLNRLELTPRRANEQSRDKKIVYRERKIEEFFAETFLRWTERPPEEIVLDFDATDDPLHGHPWGRFFHGDYDSYCYLPLDVFFGEHLRCGKLRPADIDASAGSRKVLQRLVAKIRGRWPNVPLAPHRRARLNAARAESSCFRRHSGNTPRWRCAPTTKNPLPNDLKSPAATAPDTPVSPRRRLRQPAKNDLPEDRPF
ncbi:MAG: transposase [Pirellulales bacterium]|nr:transposase [Pirellulales bacterium]